MQGSALLVLDRWARLVPGSTPDEDREALRRELTKPEYQESILSRLQRLLDRLFGDLLGTLDSAGGAVTAVVYLLMLSLGGILLYSVVRLIRGGAATKTQVEDWADAEELPAVHLARARAALSEGNWAASTLHSFRACIGFGAANAALTVGTGLTAREAATVLISYFPQHDTDLTLVTDLLEASLYGDQALNAGDARRALDVALALEHAEPGAGPTPILDRLAVPR